jgi:hypothetical protein
VIILLVALREFSQSLLLFKQDSLLHGWTLLMLTDVVSAWVEAILRVG